MRLTLFSVAFFVVLSARFASGQSWTYEYQFAIKNSSATKTFQIWLPPNVTHIKGLLFTNSVGTDLNFATDSTIRAAAAQKKLGVLRVIGSHYSTFGGEITGAGPDGITTNLGAGYATLEEEFLATLDTLARRVGHPEIRYAPFLTYGHSTSGLFARNVGWWNPSRVFGIIIYKSGKFTKPTWAAPNATLADIPVMMFPGEFEQAAPNHGGCIYKNGAESMEMQWWANRDSILKNNRAGYLGMVVAQPLNPLLGIDSCFTTNNSWASCGTNFPACNMHTQWVGSEYRGAAALNLLALFIKKAADAKLPDSTALGGPVRLKSIDKRDGVFVTTTELRKGIIEADLSQAGAILYHYDDYPGNPDSTFWFFDHEFALDWIYYMNNAGPYDGANKGYVPVVSTPRFTLTGSKLMITTSTKGAKIYYSKTGDPSKDRSGIEYTGEITLSTNESVKAIAYKIDDKYHFHWRHSPIGSFPDVTGTPHRSATRGTQFLAVSPNPCSSGTSIFLKMDKPATVRVYTGTGQLIKTIRKASSSMEISVADMSPGLYFFVAEGNKVSFIKN